MDRAQAAPLAMDMTGKTVLVTGGSGGLGRHFAGMLASRGASVILAARRRAALEQACAEIVAAGGKARAIELDVNDGASVEKAIASVEGGIDVLVNNAGINRVASALDLQEADWDAVVDTNLKGVFVVAQAVARRMVAAGKGGSIVNIASILGLRVAAQVAPYAATKAAVIQLTKALALEWARHGIRVNAICPGYFETDINRDFLQTEAGEALIRRIPQRRVGRQGELDGPLLLLCSDAGSYITGVALAVDGGHLVSTL